MQRIFITIVAVLLLASCGVRNAITQKFFKPQVTISALAAPSISDKSYILVSASEALEQSDPLFYSHLAKQAESRLSEMGYKLVDNKKLAAQMILLDYRRSGPVSNTQAVSMPVWGQTGVSSSTTNGRINTGVTSFGRYGTVNSDYNATTTYTPSYGVTGYQNKLVTKTFYSVGVSLQSVDLRDLTKNKKVTTLWIVKATSTGNTPDSLADFKGLISMMGIYAGQTLESDIQMNVDPKKML